MKRRLAITLLLAALSLNSCGGQGIEVGNPTLPSGSIKRLQGFLDINADDGSPLYKLVFLRDDRVAIQAPDDTVIVRPYQVSGDQVAFQASTRESGGDIVEFSATLTQNFSVSSLTLTKNLNPLKVSYKNHLGVASEFVTGQYQDTLNGTCRHFGYNLAVSQKSSDIRIEDAQQDKLYLGSVSSDGFLGYESEGTAVESWSCEGSVVEGRLSGVCSSTHAPDSLCTLFFKKH